MPSRLRFAFLASALTCVLVSGCGGTASITGTVNLDGQPVDGGAITFIPDGGKESAGSGHIVAGRYEVKATKKLTPGKYTVQINWMKGTGKKVKNESDPGVESDETYEAVPPQYNAGSKLSVDLTSGSNTHNFDLKGAQPPTGATPQGAPKGKGNNTD